MSVVCILTLCGLTSQKTLRGGLWLGGSVHEEAHPCFPYLVQPSFKGTDAGSIYHPLVQLIPSINHSTQLNEHVRTQVLTPQCPHLFNTTTYETTRLLLHVLIYLQFRPGRLCNHTRHPGTSKTCLNVL